MRGVAGIVVPGTIVINPGGQTSASAGYGTTSGTSMSLGKNITNGNSVIAAVGETPNTYWTLTAAVGSVPLTQVINTYFSGALFYGNGLVPSPASKAITCTSSDSSGFAGAAIEVSGLSGAPVKTAISVNQVQTLTMTPQIAGDLMVFAIMGFGSPTFSTSASTPNSGWVTAGTGNPIQLVACIAPSTSPVTATWTGSMSGIAYGVVGMVIA